MYGTERRLCVKLRYTKVVINPLMHEQSINYISYTPRYYASTIKLVAKTIISLVSNYNHCLYPILYMTDSNAALTITYNS